MNNDCNVFFIRLWDKEIGGAVIIGVTEDTMRLMEGLGGAMGLGNNYLYRYKV